MPPRKPGGRKRIQRSPILENFKLEGEKGKEKFYFKREETGNKWVEESRGEEDRRTRTRRGGRKTHKRWGEEELIEEKRELGDPPSKLGKRFRVPEHVYEESLKKQKFLFVTEKKVDTKNNYIEIINRRTSKNPKGKRKGDTKKRIK